MAENGWLKSITLAHTVAELAAVVRCMNCIRRRDGTCPVSCFKSDEDYCSWGIDYRDSGHKNEEEDDGWQSTLL